MSLKIGFLSDWDFRASGYFNISSALCTGLSERGHDVKAIGLGYRGEEHDYPFGIIPSRDLLESSAIAQNLSELWDMDLLIVALDIPVQEQFMLHCQGRKYKYAGIFPLEAPPLCATWAISLMQMDKRFVISKFGTLELETRGVPAVHLPVGIDTESWRMPTEEERKRIRNNALSLDDDTFVVLTVADNQERKNLSAALEAFALFSERVPNSRYMLVTRIHNLVGWKLDDLAQELGISDKFMKFERGISFAELWSLYAASDLFLLPSKAEGLGLPLLEAMATGVLCFGTACTGIAESLSDGRGVLIPAEYEHRDPFGNGNRWWIDHEKLVQSMLDYHYTWERHYVQPFIEPARKYVEGLAWEKSVDILCENIKEYENGEKKTTEDK
jgi:glycosyltransferase involved in cell wall biosynthesis